MFCKFVLSTLLCYFCENSMIADTALVVKDAFAPRFSNIQAVLDSVDFFFFFGKLRGNSG